MEDAISHAQSSLPAGRFEGRVAFQQLVRDALACAAREGWPELILSDASFHDWPLGERAVADSLQDWARAGRRFVLDHLPSGPSVGHVRQSVTFTFEHKLQQVRCQRVIFDDQDVGRQRVSHERSEGRKSGTVVQGRRGAVTARV